MYIIKQKEKHKMETIQLDEIRNVIKKLELLLNKIPEDSAEHEEMLELLGRAEKQRDELIELDEKGERFVQDVKKYLNS